MAIRPLAAAVRKNLIAFPATAFRKRFEVSTPAGPAATARPLAPAIPIANLMRYA